MHRWTPLLVSAAVVLAVIGLVVPTASAAGSASASVSPQSPPAGTTGSYTYKLTPSTGQVGSFNLTAPTGWSIISVDPYPGVTLASGSSTVIQGRNLMVTSSSPLTITFTAQAPCAAGNVAWTTVARSSGTFGGASIPVNDVGASVTGTCTAAFVTGRQPADAAFNTNVNGPSQNITSVPFTPSGDAIQAIVKDALGSPRAGISVALAFASNPTGASLAGSTTAVSDSNGLATFDGTCAACSPITINKISQGYALKPTGAGVVGTTQLATFGVYQEGTPCDATHTCRAQGHSENNRLTATVTAPPNGTLGVLVTSDAHVVNAVACAGFTSPFTTQAVIVWKYTGDGSQTIVVDVSKQMMREVLDRGSAHLDFCFDSEGKPFTDKFGVDHWGDSGNDTNGLLPDCNMTPDDTNCIVSETALGGGGRRIVVTVEDGKGRI